MQVKVPVEFLVENCGKIFGEETSDPPCPAAEEWLPSRDPEVRGSGVEGCHRLGLGMPEPSASFLAGMGIVCGPLSPACLMASLCPCLLGHEHFAQQDELRPEGRAQEG